ncbi:MAG: N-acetyltransferase, partial [Bacteroidetes bacterium QH_2_64_74]
MRYPDVRRAQSDDQMTVGDLWVQLLREQDELDDRFGVADNARER